MWDLNEFLIIACLFTLVNIQILSVGSSSFLRLNFSCDLENKAKSQIPNHHLMVQDTRCLG